MIADKATETAAASERAAATQAFKQYFLNDSSETAQKYRDLVASVAWEISEQISTQEQPYSGRKPADLFEKARSTNFFPENGASLTEVLTKTRELVLKNNISVYHPHCLAHLHCPVFISSLAAEMIISAFNQSMDSFDQAPAATMIEQALGEALCRLYGFGPNADATFTGGGTMSNFMGLLLARDHFSHARCGWNIQQRGLPPEASRFRILCAELAHFTVSQSASILGLGQQAVVKIPTPEFTEEVSVLETTINELRNQGLIPIAYVTTAGTTDFGTISNLNELAECAKNHGIWLHVDAAYGGGLIFSETHRQKLAGIEKADSVTIDFHKLFYQPISCGVFLVKNKAMFDYIKLHAEYLNPESNEQFGIIDLVYKSIQTTRRFDALKPFLALQHVGTRKFGEMVDHTIAIAASISETIQLDPQFELAHRPMLNAIVFRYVPSLPIEQEAENVINNRIKSDLLLSGEAIIGQTMLQGKAFLKFTLLNPMTEPESIVALLSKIKNLGQTLEAAYANAAVLIADEA